MNVDIGSVGLYKYKYIYIYIYTPVDIYCTKYDGEAIHYSASSTGTLDISNTPVAGKDVFVRPVLVLYIYVPSM